MNVANSTTEITPRVSLACYLCSWQGNLATRYRCPLCGESLKVVYPILPGPTDWLTAESGLWRYRSLLPVLPHVKPISLGEGSTALLRADRLTISGQLLLKNESTNPTASFKDRPVSVAITMALEFDLSGVICASTGNTGVAVAAYAARASLPAICLVPHTTPTAKLAQIEAVGGQIVRVRGTYSDAHALAQLAAEQYGWANLTSTYVNPYMLEGDKTVGYEIFEQLANQVPDWILVPVGAGPLLSGIYKAFCELKEAGVSNGQLPRMIAVQAASCAPIVQAFEADKTSVTEWEQEIDTSASSIADPLRGYMSDGTRTLRTVRESKGLAIAVSEAEIRDALAGLARSEGLIVEPGTAVVVAAYRRLASQKLFDRHERIVLLLTGHGLKDIETLQAVARTTEREEPPIVEPGDVQVLGKVLEKRKHNG